MVTVNILHLKEGHSREEKSVEPKDAGFVDDEEIIQPINITFDIDKVGTEHYIKAHFNTIAHFNCDRCAEEFDLKISDDIRIILTRDESLLEQDDVYKINDGTSIVDITESVKEALVLAFPGKKLCSKDCQGLCVVCGANLNKETCTCEKDQIDPRWEALKKLLDK